VFFLFPRSFVLFPRSFFVFIRSLCLFSRAAIFIYYRFFFGFLDRFFISSLSPSRDLPSYNITSSTESSVIAYEMRKQWPESSPGQREIIQQS
jgi:hypothetical protein